MKIRLIVFMLFCLLAAYFQAEAQNAKVTLTDADVRDPLLFNGKLYTFFPPFGTTGSQFMFTMPGTSSSIRIRGIEFNEITLTYDLLNQLLVLIYTNALGGTERLVVSQAWLESFQIGSQNFVLIPVEGNTKRIYQQLGSGNTKLLYYFSKEILLDKTVSSGKYYFSNTNRKMFVQLKGLILSYNSNRSFIKLFGRTNHDLLKNFIRKNKINVKKADDNTMTLLIDFCNTLN